MIVTNKSGKQETIIKFLKKHLEIKHKNGLEWQALCPYHEDKSPSFSINIRKGLFICYACGAKGNMKQLAEHLDARAPADSPSATLEEVIETIETLLKSEYEVVRPTVGIPYPAEYLLSDAKDQAFEYWFHLRGLDAKTIEDYRLSFDTITEDAIVPLCDINGRIGGFIRRVTDPRALTSGKPKYLYPKGLQISHYLFGADIAQKTLHENKTEKVNLVITEGSIDAMSVYPFARQDANKLNGLSHPKSESQLYVGVAILGSRISNYQAQIIKKLAPDKIIIATDRDRAGREAETQISWAIKEMKMGIPCVIAKWDSSIGKDLAELNIYQRRNILVGC